MKRSAAILLGIVLLGTPTTAQQQVPTVSPDLVKYGKWGLLATSVAMNILAARAHDQAEKAFAVITETCAIDRFLCLTFTDGRYVDFILEDQYQKALHHDTEARRWLIGGETALVGAAVMFIWELTRPKGRPENIPFTPEVSERDGRTTVGFRVTF